MLLDVYCFDYNVIIVIIIIIAYVANIEFTDFLI
jgi:hypothetical protein